MAKIHSDVLLKKYYFDHTQTRAFYYNPITKKVSFEQPKQKVEIEGQPKTYGELTNEILNNNLRKINNRVLKLNEDSWRKSLQKISNKEKKFIMPSLPNILEKSNLELLKTQEHGKIIKNTLKNELTRNLRDVLNNFTPKTQEQTYLLRRGEKAGKINPKLIKEFQNRITETFQNYTLKDPRFNVPVNIKTIAVTEIRSLINPLKKIYTDNLIEKNRGKLEFYKTWIHNSFLSKIPRHGHKKMNMVKIPYAQQFKVPVYKKVNKRYYISNYLYTDHPHDTKLPLSEKIGCNCDWIITAKRI